MQTDLNIITMFLLSVCLPVVVLTEDCISHKIWIYPWTWTKMWCKISFRGLLSLSMGIVILFVLYMLQCPSGRKLVWFEILSKPKINGLDFSYFMILSLFNHLMYLSLGGTICELRNCENVAVPFFSFLYIPICAVWH